MIRCSRGDGAGVQNIMAPAKTNHTRLETRHRLGYKAWVWTYRLLAVFLFSLPCASEIVPQKMASNWNSALRPYRNRILELDADLGRSTGEVD
jgi:hypothetical protein